MTITSTAGATTAPAGRATVLGLFTTGSADWHAARAQGVGGSEIAAVMGLSPYESRFSLWHRKQGLLGQVEQNPAMYWGTLLEPTICSEFAKRHPEWAVSLAPTYAGPGRPWQIANPDRLLTPTCGCDLHRDPCCEPNTGNLSDCGPCCEDCPTCPTENNQPTAILEAKTARDDEGWGEEGTDEIPVHYRAQCLWYLDTLGLTTCHIGVLIAGSEYREYVVTYDATEALILRASGERFIRTVRDGERPSIDGHTATYQAIRELPDGLDDIDVEISPDLRDRFHAAQDGYWAAEEELTACKGELLDAIGTGRRANVAAQRVATRTVRNGRTYQLLPARTRRTAR